VDQHNAQYKEWQKYVESKHGQIDDEYEIWNNAFDGDTSEHGAYGNRWWNKAGSEYDMPHQALHGGVSLYDDEADLPLNSYWHKVTMSPESWSMLRTYFAIIQCLFLCFVWKKCTYLLFCVFGQKRKKCILCVSDFQF
jgi:hypothetical protein